MGDILLWRDVTSICESQDLTLQTLSSLVLTPSETVEKVETFHSYYSCTVRNQLLTRQRKRLIRGFKGFSTVSPVTFTSKKSKKGVYYNPHFTINNPDTEGVITSFNNYIDAI